MHLFSIVGRSQQRLTTMLSTSLVRRSVPVHSIFNSIFNSSLVTTAASHPVSSSSSFHVPFVSSVTKSSEPPLLAREFRLTAEIELAGEIHMVAPNQVLRVNRMNVFRVGELITLDRVRAIFGKEQTILGQPYVSPSLVAVNAVVLEQSKDAKVWIEKTKKRKHYHKRFSHRQRLTVLRITDITVQTA
jgi:large subunit ribosomal protein L21